MSGTQPIQQQPSAGYGQPQQAVYSQPPQPVYAQPSAASYGQSQVMYMQGPPQIPGVPPGLEYLSSIDQLVIKQTVELFEVLTSIEGKNKYRISNAMGQQVFLAAEESECIMRFICGPRRGFIIHIYDNFNREVLRAIRAFKCCAGCYWCAHLDCCGYTLEVQAPVGIPIGYVRQECSVFNVHYTIRDANFDVVSRIRGPCCSCSCPGMGDVQFPVTNPDESVTYGNISKQWSGCLKECMTKADTFQVSFPQDMDVRLKATTLAATFLIEFMLFENNSGSGGRDRGLDLF